MHPDIENIRRDFVRLAEIAEDKSVFRQTRIVAGYRRDYGTGVVVWQTGLWQPRDLFAEPTLPLSIDHGFVADNIIHVGSSTRAGKAEKIHLNWRGTIGKNRGRRVLRVPHQIDRNIDFQPAD